MKQESQPQTYERTPHYVAILVRSWRDGQQLRFMVENVVTREKRGFESFESVNSYLKELLKELA